MDVFYLVVFLCCCEAVMLSLGLKAVASKTFMLKALVLCDGLSRGLVLGLFSVTCNIH